MADSGQSYATIATVTREIEQENGCQDNFANLLIIANVLFEKNYTPMSCAMSHLKCNYKHQRCSEHTPARRFPSIHPTSPLIIAFGATSIWDERAICMMNGNNHIV